jgi:hypothetical protein
VRAAAIFVGVEDSKGNVVFINLYNYPSLRDATLEDLDSLFPLGTILLIREPSYRMNVQGMYYPYIHVDSPSDVIIIDPDDPIAKDFICRSASNEPLPAKSPTTIEEWRAHGASEFKANRWLAAAICYTRGLRQDSGSQIFLLNRAEAYLRLGWYFSALHDIEKAQKLGPFADANLARKSVLRAIRANYGLCKYDCVVQLAQQHKGDASCKEWLVKAEKRIHERHFGEYDWFAVFECTDKPNTRLDVASYQGPVIVRDRDGEPGVRGVFVTRDVQIGELLVSMLRTAPVLHLCPCLQFVATPLASAFPNETTCRAQDFDSHNFILNAPISLAQSLVMSNLVQRVWDDAQALEVLKTMYIGPSQSGERALYPPRTVGRRPLEHPTKSTTDIDISLIEAVVSFSDFGLRDERSFKEPEKKNDSIGVALFELPSFCNHACLPTGHRTVAGDVMIVRAAQCLQAGDEVTLSYTPYHLEYDERIKRLSSWRFECDCRLCRADRIDGEAARGERRRLYNEAKSVMHEFCTLRSPPTTSTRDGFLDRNRDIFEKIQRTYIDCDDRRRSAVKAELETITKRMEYIVRISQKDADIVQANEEIINAEMQALDYAGLVIKEDAKKLRGSCSSSMIPFDSERCYLTQGTCSSSVICCLRIAQCMMKLGQRDRAKAWVNAAKWGELTYSGSYSSTSF